MSSTADVVVVGAGALGLSTALHLALRGRQVVLVERDRAGSQASGRAAGLFKSIQADEVRTTLARRSIERALRFEEWAGVALSVVRSGSLAIARTPAHTGLLRREVAASRGWGVAIDDLAVTGLADRSSLYRPTGVEVAWWCPDDVYIEEPMSLVDAYLAAFRLHGGQVREGATVVGIDVAAGAVVAVETDDGRIATGTVVDAAGAWTRPVAALAGAWVPVAPVRHQLMITEPTDAVDPGDPIVRVVDAAVYLRPARGGLMVGGFEADPLALPTDPPRQTGDVPLDVEVLSAMARSLEQEVPTATVALPAELRGGMFTMSPDGRFVVGRTSVDGLWVASGCNGSGFSSSLGIGEALAADIVGAAPVADLASFAPGRIAATDDDGLVRAGSWQYAHYYDPAD